MLRRSVASVGAAAFALVGLLLAGCSPAFPAGPGSVADSDTSNPVPIESWNPGIGSSDGGDLAADRAVDVLFQPSWQGIAPGTTLTLQRRDANCVRNEYDGTFEIKYGAMVTLMRTYAGSFACGTERSWATWTATFNGTDGSHRSAVLEVAQVSSVGEDPMVLELKCYGGDLGCDTFRQSVPKGNFGSMQTRFFAV